MSRSPRSTHRRPVMLAATAMIAAMTSAAPGALILYEPFAYSTGTLNGQNGGTGFSGVWSSTGTSASVITSPGLSYGVLQTTGNTVIGTTSMWMNPTFSSTGLTGNGSTLWLSADLDNRHDY